IEVTAQKTLEWDRDAKTFTARQDAIAKQGTSELHGDTLVAKYNEGADGKGMTINRIDATGHVKVISEGSVATGDQGFFNMKDNYAELTGNNLKMVTKTDTVTARDKLTYHMSKREMNAYGNAVATRGDDVIHGDRLIGRMKPGVSGKDEMDEMEAIGNVVVTTPTDILYGDRAIYQAASNKTIVTGNVRIERGPNIITGSRGEMDMNTNVSKIFGGTPNPASVDSTGTAAPGADGRVRGVFYPE
ncbi:MAG TPA: LptA/OstA family protein, partial [Alphaproteobacteria bacterium]